MGTLGHPLPFPQAPGSCSGKPADLPKSQGVTSGKDSELLQNPHCVNSLFT